MKKFGVRIATVLSAALLALGTGTTASANADTSTASYADQALALGLTAEEADTLQSQVDAYLAELGGIQVAINKIQLKGAELLVTLPGEEFARDLDSTGDASIAQHGSCPYYYFCAYSQTGYYGDTIKMFYCQNYSMPWSGYGSYYNNQTLATRATFKSSSGSVIGYSVPPPGGATSIYWTPIWYVKPC